MQATACFNLFEKEIDVLSHGSRVIIVGNRNFIWPAFIQFSIDFCDILIYFVLNFFAFPARIGVVGAAELI